MGSSRGWFGIFVVVFVFIFDSESLHPLPAVNPSL